MKLSQLISALPKAVAGSGLLDFEVKGVASHSKEVQGDFIFVAIAGTAADGNEFIEEAVARGAKALVVRQGSLAAQRLYPGVVVLAVEDTRQALAQLACAWYGDPSMHTRVIGITGTNGKTTIAYLIEALCAQAHKPAGVIGTVTHRFAGRSLPSHNTTPGALALQGMLRAMVDAGVAYVAMEVSSHALDQERVAGTTCRYAVFTNLTQDHLDYHASLEEYFLAKAKLFEQLAPEATAVVNNDDAYGRRLAAMTHAKVLSYGIDSLADVMATDIAYGVDCTQLCIRGLGQKIRLTTCLIGKHNVYNVLAAVAVAMSEGFDQKSIHQACAALACVPGRLQRIDTDKGFSVFVDYAHTDDALRNVIGSLRQITQGKIIVVFGCGGNRDAGKRPKMGKIAAALADYCILTSDNPRNEDPGQIIAQIQAGIATNNFCVRLDRQEAISHALAMAMPGDIVLVAGKGHEDYQVFKNQTIHFDDCEVVRACLRSRN